MRRVNECEFIILTPYYSPFAMNKTIDFLSVFGQISATVQGLVCILLALLFVLVSAMLTLKTPVKVQSKVLGVESTTPHSYYIITAEYIDPVSGELKIGTLTSKVPFVIGTDPGLSLTPTGSITLTRPWGTYSIYLLSGASALLGLAYLAINVVASRKTAAAFAGGIALLNIVYRAFV